MNRGKLHDQRNPHLHGEMPSTALRLPRRGKVIYAASLRVSSSVSKTDSPFTTPGDTACYVRHENLRDIYKPDLGPSSHRQPLHHGSPEAA